MKYHLSKVPNVHFLASLHFLIQNSRNVHELMWNLQLCHKEAGKHFVILNNSCCSQICIYAGLDVMSGKYIEFLYCSVDLDTTLRDNEVRIFCNIFYMFCILQCLDMICKMNCSFLN